MKDKIASLRYQSSLILFGHLLNPLWKSREDRRRRRSAATAAAVRKYLSIYGKEIANADIPVTTDASEGTEYAFSIWFQREENAPECIKACFGSMRKHLKQKLIVLDEKTLFDWISLPDYIIEKWRSGKIGYAHFSDICRVELLYRYGGVWLDATDYVTAPVPEYIMDSDFFVFMAGQKIVSWYGFIQNCFIRAKKGDPLLGLWRDAMLMYWQHEDKMITYYGHQILFQVVTETNEKAASLFAKMPKVDQDPTHVLWYGHRDDPYDSINFKEYTAGAFFQKTDFKDIRARKPLPGSIAAFMFGSEDTQEDKEES